jgi:hypothetical protein
MRQTFTVIVCSVLVTLATLTTNALCQTSTLPEQRENSASSIVGTVVSTSRETMVVRSEDNQFYLLVFDRDFVRPKGLTPGARVRVASNATDEAGLRLATGVTVLEPTSTPEPGAALPDAAPPPKQMRELDREIEKNLRRVQFGVRIGAGLDPELFLIGVHAGIGPVFSRDFYFRPNAEFAFGELTDMVAINLEGAYRLPITFRYGRWSSYVGAGPSFNFIHQGLERREINFGNFTYETGLNIFTGVRFRRGTFVEVKTSLWAHPVPTLRLIFGYTF